MKIVPQINYAQFGAIDYPIYVILGYIITRETKLPQKLAFTERWFIGVVSKARQAVIFNIDNADVNSIFERVFIYIFQIVVVCNHPLQ